MRTTDDYRARRAREWRRAWLVVAVIVAAALVLVAVTW